MIALLLDREFNHSWKCLEVPIREKLDSQKLRLAKYMAFCLTYDGEEIWMYFILKNLLDRTDMNFMKVKEIC